MQWYDAEVAELQARFADLPNGDRPPIFYGSSSFRLWTTLAEDFDPRVLNLAFGGSTLEACDYYFDRLIKPFHARSLVLYAGDNDLGDGRSPEQVLVWFRSLADKVADTLGPIPFGFVSVKPSPARHSLIDRIRRLNDLVREDIEARPSGFYVDIFPAMTDSSGNPRAEFFLADGLHLNRAGYKLWSSILDKHRHQIFTQ
jgi:lysophospholipase L1-like esterase